MHILKNKTVSRIRPVSRLSLQVGIILAILMAGWLRPAKSVSAIKNSVVSFLNSISNSSNLQVSISNSTKPIGSLFSVSPPLKIYLPLIVNPKKYFISSSGDDSNPGTQSQPWKTIQKCLDQVQPGTTCEIFGGIYNEALVLRISGTQQLRITVKNYDNQMVTVNSGSKKTIVTGGRIDYYTFDGLRLIASFAPVDQSDVSINLGKNVPFSTTDKTAGNNGYVFRNCYIEGAIHFYGHNNLMENCELNGRNIYQNGLIDNYGASYNNIYQNNLLYNYPTRGIWSMESTDNILISGNTIHNVLLGIDCDGASVPVTRCNVINNHIYNVGISHWGGGIWLEDCFNCLAQGNTVHDIQNGPGIFVMNYGNGSSENWHTFNNIEYRNTNSYTRIINNVIYNYVVDSGIYVKAVNGLVIDHNTFYNTSKPSSISLSGDYDVNGAFYCSQDETITNNIFFKGSPKWSCTTKGNILMGNYTGDPLFVNPPVDLHLRTFSLACTAGVNSTYAGAFSCQ